MLLHHLVETAQEINAIGKIADVLTQYIYGLVRTAHERDLDMFTDPNYEANMSRYGSISDGSRRPLDLDPESAHERELQVTRGIRSMLKGNIRNKSALDVTTTEIELGTLAELLKITGHRVVGLTPEQLQKIGKAWIIISDNSLYQGISFNKSTSGQPEHDESYDDNDMIILAAQYFIKPNRMNKRWVRSILSHELTHQLDNANTNGKYSTRRDGSFKGLDTNTGKQETGDNYWKLQYEVNARFTQLAHDLDTKFKNDPTYQEPSKRQFVIKRLLTRYKLTTQFIDEKQYRQIMKRLEKYLNKDNAAT